MSTPLTTLLVETTELVASATVRHHQNQQQHTSCRSSASSLFLRADGPLPLLLCWIVSLVDFVAETTSISASTSAAARGAGAGTGGQPIMSWMSNKMMSERITWCLIQILLIFFAMIINICFHLRIDNTQFTQRKKCVERFILQLHASSSSSSALDTNTNNAVTAPSESKRSESNGGVRTMWNLKANSVSVVSTYRQGVWRLVPANLLVKVRWKQLFLWFFSFYVNSSTYFCSPFVIIVFIV